MKNNKKLKVMLIQEQAPPDDVGKEVLRTGNISYKESFKDKTIEQALNLAKDYKIRQIRKLRDDEINDKTYVENLRNVNKAVAFETGYNLMAFGVIVKDKEIEGGVERNADLVKTKEIRNNNRVNRDNIADHIKVRTAKYLPLMTSTYNAFSSNFVDRPLSIKLENDKAVLNIKTDTSDQNATGETKISDLDDDFKPYANNKY